MKFTMEWTGKNEAHSPVWHFMRQCPAPIIGVTGSQENITAVSQLIAAILEQHFADQAERHIHLLDSSRDISNDSTPPITDDDIVILQLPLAQLQNCPRSPYIAILTDFDLDKQAADYRQQLQTLLNIFYYQHDGDVAVYNDKDEELAELIRHIAITSRAERLPFPDDKLAHFDNDNFYMKEEKICSIDSANLPNDHAADNVCATINAVWDLVDHDKEVIAEVLAGDSQHND